MSQILLHLLKKLLTQQDPNNRQGQDYQRRLAETIRMTERLVRMLDPGKVAAGSDYGKCQIYCSLHISAQGIFYYMAVART